MLKLCRVYFISAETLMNENNAVKLKNRYWQQNKKMTNDEFPITNDEFSWLENDFCRLSAIVGLFAGKLLARFSEHYQQKSSYLKPRSKVKWLLVPVPRPGLAAALCESRPTCRFA